MSDSRVSRRTLLIAAAATVSAAGLSTGLGGCEAGPGEPDRVAEAVIEPLTPLLIGQQQLLALYQRTLSAFPDLAVAVSDLQAQAAAHTEALLAAAPAAAAQVAAAGSASDPSASSSAPSSAQPTPAPLPPADAAMARVDLLQAVAAAAGSLRAAALRADGDLAALLGSCAASTACHARLLAS